MIRKNKNIYKTINDLKEYPLIQVCNDLKGKEN
jgi:hypothetical protein